MKIVYLYHSFIIRGGLERVLADKMNYLAENDYDIYFITSDQCGRAFAYSLSSKVHHYDLGGIRFHSIYRFRHIQRLRAIYRHEKDYKKRLLEKLNEIKPDIIVANTSFNAPLIANLPYPCKKIVESHIALPFIIKAGKEHRHQNKIKYILKSIYDIYFTTTLKKYDEMIVLTQQDQKYWAKYRHSRCIPNPVTLFPEKTKTEGETKRIIAVGRLIGNQKGFDLLIKAWSKIAANHPDWKVTIYGEGNEKQKFLDCIREHHVEDTLTIHPAVPNIYDKYRESDFLVLSSRAEGFGLVLIEAMACGIPCVSYNCPSGPDEIITHKVDGLIAENGSIDDLATQMEYMITHPEERNEMGRKARMAATRYKIENIMQQWIDLFDSLVKKKE